MRQLEVGRSCLKRRGWLGPQEPRRLRAQERRKKGLSHDDLLLVYPTQGEPGFRAIYFDNEGHVIRYKAVPPEKQLAVRLESEDPPTAMRFRLDYVPNPDGTVMGLFSMAAPGDTFKVYVQGVVHRLLVHR